MTVADSPQGIFLFLSQLWNADKIWRGNFVVSDATSCSCLGVMCHFSRDYVYAQKISRLLVVHFKLLVLFWNGDVFFSSVGLLLRVHFVDV